jgi:hypothetical protein
MDLTKLFQILQSQENFLCGKRGATDEEIYQAEQTLGIRFPHSYKLFLKNFRFAAWFGGIVLGISTDEDFDAIGYTLEVRRENLPEDFLSLPLNGLIIKRYGGGGHYFLYEKNSPRSGEVVLLLDETWRKQEEGTWKSFEDFLAYALGVEQPQPLAS